MEILREETLAGKNIMLEGFGFVAGTETTQFLAKATKRLAVDIRVIALLDAKLFHKNRGIYGDDLLISQLQAATAGVGITRFDPDVKDIDDPRLAEQIEFVLRHVHGKQIFLAPEGEPLTQAMLAIGEWYEYDHRHGYDHSCECCGDGEEFDEPEHVHEHHHHGHEHGHDHHHDHDHEPNHAGLADGFALKPTATYDEVRRVFNDEFCAKLGITRVKGAVGGRHFSSALGEWDQTFNDSRSFVTFYYLRRPEVIPEIPGRDEIEDMIPDHIVEGSTNELLRADVDPGTARAAVVELMSMIPATPMINDLGQLVTHPEELQILRQIARRASVREEFYASAIQRCVEYWLAAARLLEGRLRGSLSEEQLMEALRAVGLSLCWYAARHRDVVGETLYAQIVELRAWEMVIEGCLSMTQPQTDDKKSDQLAHEVGEALLFGLNNGADKKLTLECMTHCYKLHYSRASMALNWPCYFDDVRLRC